MQSRGLCSLNLAPFPLLSSCLVTCPPACPQCRREGVLPGQRMRGAVRAAQRQRLAAGPLGQRHVPAGRAGEGASSCCEWLDGAICLAGALPTSATPAIPPSTHTHTRITSAAAAASAACCPQVGVEPEVRRIGKFKSAGDQLLREDMSAAQRLQLTELLDDIYQRFLSDIAASRGKSVAEVRRCVRCVASRRHVFYEPELRLGTKVTLQTRCDFPLPFGTCARVVCCRWRRS